MIVSLSTTSQGELLVGTKAANIFKIALEKVPFSQAETIMSGHSNGHIWGLAVDHDRKNKYFYTGGEDQRLIKWQYGL